MELENFEKLELELTADQLIGALLWLDPSRRLSVLDSCGARGDDSRFLIAGFDPVETIEAFGTELQIRSCGEKAPSVQNGSVLSLLDQRLQEFRAAHNPAHDFPTTGACIAVLAYDLARQFGLLRRTDGQGKRPQYEADIQPDAVFAFYDTLVIHDYTTARTRLVSSRTSMNRLPEIGESLRQAAAEAERKELVPDGTTPGSELDGNGTFGRASSDAVVATSNFTRAEYVAAVQRIREHIFAGDIYQANLTQRIKCTPRAGATPEVIFKRLRREHPASFAAFIRLREGSVVSASPERFVSVQPFPEQPNVSRTQRIVEARPIKGTRPRGQTEAEDMRLRTELLASGKDRAENIMIVDLMRNDLGRVCRYGSVEVAQLCALQEHPTLFHLVSKVRGVLRENVTVSDLLGAIFPSGSITGAPKIRAMEILDQIETEPRGFSMGALGYFSFDGAVDLNVAIRTITFGKDGAVSFNVGGGVVAESDATAEYEESLLKARALLRALDARLADN